MALPTALTRQHTKPDRANTVGMCHLLWTEKAAEEQQIGLGQAAVYRLNEELLG